MPLLADNIELSKAIDHGTHGKCVKYYCFKTGRYETEKHTHDHEQFMRQQDAGIIRIILRLIEPELTKLAANGEFKSVNVRDALKGIDACILALSDTGCRYAPFVGMEPYSAATLYTAASFLRLLLPELNVIKAPSATRTAEKTYKQLLHLANVMESRYELVTYNDLTHSNHEQ